jgi:UDP-N-acetylmuramoyl-tripeptide--D-alanyl-D-alanine ligase
MKKIYTMFANLKKVLYFPIASYFRYFAQIRLKKWNPRVVVVTGSAGKTTLLHMLEAQLGTAAKYSHHANSSFGVPFDILGLQRKTLQKFEWIGLFLFAPIKLLSAVPKEKIYVVEADCDRPQEGKFLAEFLKPEVVLWVSTARTHSMNFDPLVEKGTFPAVEDAIAYEYGYFLEYCQKLAVIDGESALQIKQQSRTKAEVKAIKKSAMLQSYAISGDGTTFQINNKSYLFRGAFLPEESFYEVAMAIETVKYLQMPHDDSYKNFVMPPGRGSIFEGIKQLAIVDSSYNSNLSSAIAILKMFEHFPGEKKWVVIGDMLEQGKEEQEEHEKLADVLAQYEYERVLLMGPRVSKYTHPKLVALKGGVVTNLKFEEPKDVLNYLTLNIQGGETILFKGARFLEGVIEHLLKNPADVAKLARREKIWQDRRKKWGL